MHRLLVLFEREAPDLTPVHKSPAFPAAPSPYLASSLFPCFRSLPRRTSYYFLCYIFISILSIMYSRSIYTQYMLCDHKAFMSPESCSKVLSAAGKPRHICDNRDPINQGWASVLFCLLKQIYQYISYYCHISNLYFIH